MDAAFEVAEDLCEQMGLTIPGPELFKIAGAIAATEAVKSGLELLIPSASTAMTFRLVIKHANHSKLIKSAKSRSYWCKGHATSNFRVLSI